MIFVFKKKSVLNIALALITICVLSVLVASNEIIPAAAVNRKLPVYCVDSTSKQVALTFDAAWGADKTEGIMDILEKNGCKATFFLVGFWIDNYPDTVKKISERGHLIGNHSANHLHMSKLSEKEIGEEIEITSKKIEELTGQKPKYFRAPFGEYNNRLIEYAENNNIQVIQWDVDTLDWKGLSGAGIADRVLSKVKDGSIILCHNNSDHILEALPLILLGLKNKGLTPVTLDKMVFDSGYYIDNNGKQIKKH